MEKLYTEESFESRNSELENEYETQELYHKLKTLEEREWFYQDHINEQAKRESLCRAELKESLVKLECREKMNDALEKKFREERSTYVKLVSGTLQQVDSLILKLGDANKKKAVVERELGEATAYLRVAELKLQFANERVTRRDSDVNDSNNSLCISEERANDATALVELKNDELIRFTRTVGGLQIDNKILENEKFMLTQELASKIKESQDAMEAVLREKEDIFKELDDTKLQSQIKEKELQEELASKIKESQVAMEVVCREKEDIFIELKDTKLQSQIKEKELQEELALKIKESQVAMEVVCREKEDVFKELEDTKLQSQIKEKELQEELEVALCEKKIFFEHLRFKLQEKELAPQKTKRTKRAERATCIKSIVALISVALIFAFITVIYLWGKKY